MAGREGRKAHQPVSTLTNIPPEMARSRVLTSEQAAEFVGVSLVHFRRGYRTGKYPTPIKVGVRKYGWKLREMVEWLESRPKATFE